MVASVAAAMIPLAVTAGSVVSREALEGAGAAVVVETLEEIADALSASCGV
jgi:phosphoglycolate phosphatase-like HAD superfamily hydrolase